MNKQKSWNIDQLTKTSFLKEARGESEKATVDVPVATYEIVGSGPLGLPTLTFKEQGEGKEVLVEQFIATYKIVGDNLWALRLTTMLSLESCLQMFEGGDADAEMEFCMAYLDEHHLSGEALEAQLDREEATPLRDRQGLLSPIPYWGVAIGYYNDARNLIFPGMIDFVDYKENLRHLTDEKREAAWSHLAKARYYCGKAEIFARLPAILKEKSRVEGAIRRKPDSERRFFQHQKIALEFLRANKKMRWTKAQAKVAVRDHLNYLYAKGRLDVKLDEGDGGIKTVSRWLSKMPGAAELLRKI